MYTLKLVMNICSNGLPGYRQAIAERERAFRPADGPLARFQHYRDLWHRCGFDTYQYTLSRGSATVPESDIRVRVEAGRVVTAFKLREDDSVEASAVEAATIDGYLQRLERVLHTDSEAVRAEYHPLYGYPQSIVMARRESIADLVATEQRSQSHAQVSR